MTVTPESVMPQSGIWGATSLFYMLLVPGIILWYAYWRMSRRHLYELADKLSGPSGLPLLGSALEFTGGSHGVYKYLQGSIEVANVVVDNYTCVDSDHICRLGLTHHQLTSK